MNNTAGNGVACARRRIELAVSASGPATVCPQRDCPFSAHTRTEMDKHLKEQHKELNCGRPTCGWCGRSFAPTRSRGVHLHSCAMRRQVSAPAAPPTPTTSVLPPDDIVHFLVCPRLESTRTAHHVAEYRRVFGKRYFFSLAFMRWVHHCTDGPLATPSAPPPPEPPDSSDCDVDDWEFDD
eukprot:PhM_4_TR15905/c1_g1_i3/m.32484